jgi:hypothetical protein
MAQGRNVEENDDVIGRLRAVLDYLDPRASLILAYHAGIEHELDRALARQLPNPQLLRKLGFGQKVSVWGATQNRSADDVDTEVRLLLTLNELRNAVAHGDNRAAVDAHLRRLLENTEWTEAPLDDDAVHFAAGWLFGIVNEVE